MTLPKPISVGLVVGIVVGAAFFLLSFFTVYFHLTHHGALVAVGDFVQQGDVIARSGNSGDSGQPHLHFDVQLCGINLPPNYNQLSCGQTLPVHRKIVTSLRKESQQYIITATSNKALQLTAR